MPFERRIFGPSRDDVLPATALNLVDRAAYPIAATALPSPLVMVCLMVRVAVIVNHPLS